MELPPDLNLKAKEESSTVDPLGLNVLKVQLDSYERVAEKQKSFVAPSSSTRLVL